MVRSLILLAGLVTPLQANDGADELLAALQARASRAAKENGPSIARIHVSRSQAYHKATWGMPFNHEFPGALGRFDAAAARKVIASDPRRERLMRDIADHDMSDPVVVPESFGSGFVIDRTGLIVTNYHVIKGATKLYVRLPGKGGSWADIHAADPRSDLAVLRLLAPPAGLKELELGDGGAVRIGQFVVSLSNPFAPGFKDDDGPVFGYGTVSGLRKTPPGYRVSETDLHLATLHHYGTLIQTDARVVPGCSGGVLLNLEGKVVGLTSALAAIPGERLGGFAYPIDAGTKRILEVLKRGEEVEYGFLGVVLQPPAFGGIEGVRLYRVSPGSPAHKAGLMSGDIVVKINGETVRKNSDLFLQVGVGLSGGTAKVEARRGTILQTFEVKLAKFYYPGPILAAKRPPARFGLRVDHSSILTQRNPFPLSGPILLDGVAVREVIPDSPADAERLQPDKLITHVDGKKVTTPAEYVEAIKAAGKTVKLTILTSSGRPEDISLSEK